ncbi:hypothetical protein G7Y89_g5857 [Cudoniella acicularis]|uniref:3-hydroxyisobutyrate dehydrogenase n=1 Tax=Cudoniella acicularis TaxID=354080 RepID=A0A8H4RLN3_9HELO|nr:hypothetical protein G7Y89_g5857 [Cudoniella acicularis]
MMYNDEDLEKLAHPQYWDARYRSEQRDSQNGCHILHLGCGSSHLTADLYALGYTNQNNVDFSSVVINAMKIKYSYLESARWAVMDVRDLQLPDSDIDIAIDKGLVDVMIHGSLWDPPADVRENIRKYVQEVARVLRPGGKWLYITYRQPHFIKPLLLERQDLWDLEVDLLDQPGGALDYFGFVMTKRCPLRFTTLNADRFFQRKVMRAYSALVAITARSGPARKLIIGSGRGFRQRNGAEGYWACTPPSPRSNMRSNVRISAPFVRATLQHVQRRNFSASLGRNVQWGFIGLGQMGYNMARNLQAKLPSSDTLRIYDINSASVERFANETKALSSGAAVQIAASVREAAENSETTITVLPEPSHVKNVFGQILKLPLSTDVVANPNRLFIDCSTIDPASSREVANAVHTTQQGRFIDAPMSGGVVGATAGTLTFMVGAPDAVISHVEPILLMMGKKALHCGPQGAGLSGKLANNYLLAINNIATAEAMNLGIKWGLDPKVLGNLINVSTGKCWPSEANNPVKGVVENSPASRDYSGGFGISLMKKDLKLAIQAASEAGARLELGDKARDVYEAAEAQENCKGRDFSVIYRYIGGEE